MRKRGTMTDGHVPGPSPLDLVADSMPHDLGGIGDYDNGVRVLAANDLFQAWHLAERGCRVKYLLFLPRIGSFAAQNGHAPLDLVENSPGDGLPAR